MLPRDEPGELESFAAVAIALNYAPTLEKRKVPIKSPRMGAAISRAMDSMRSNV